jgi:hypothetical protein
LRALCSLRRRTVRSQFERSGPTPEKESTREGGIKLGKWTNGEMPAGEAGWDEDGLDLYEEKRLERLPVAQRFALVAPDRLAAPGDAPTHHEHDHRRRRSTWQVSMISPVHAACAPPMRALHA